MDKSLNMRVFTGLILFCLAMATSAFAGQITVFAAASMQDALTEAGGIWGESRSDSITVAAAGSAILARQIAQGAPADLYISANPIWMDWLADRSLIIAETRRDIAGNALVLISSDDTVTPDMPVLDVLGEEGRLATALTEAVPAGIYAREALESLGQWEAVRPRLAETEHVRAALALVAMGETPLGIVYLSDAISDPRVHIVQQFPPQTHSPIRYPAAVLRGASHPDLARDFLTWLSGEQGQAVLARHGFGAAP